MDDRIDAGIVEIQVDESGKVWVNIDGKCALRIGHVALLRLDNKGNRGTVYADPGRVWE